MYCTPMLVELRVESCAPCACANCFPKPGGPHTDARKLVATRSVLVQGAGGSDKLRERQQQLECISLDYEDADALSAALKGTSVVMHTAGPYLGKHPEILEVSSRDLLCDCKRCPPL